MALATVITVSDSVARGERDDRLGARGCAGCCEKRAWKSTGRTPLWTSGR
jgi:hypothetical protein